MLGRDKINQIEQKAREVLVDVENEKGEIELPINLGKILEKNAISLKMGQFAENDILGAYDKNSKTILVSKDDQYSRKAFTVAHELGHYFLHKDKENEIFYRKDIINPDFSSDSKEQEANWFAASLLMPKESVINYWNKFQDVDIMIKLFAVSRSAMLYRLENLNLLNE